jgi:hypothetical protein
MKKIRYILLVICGMILSFPFFTSCEIKEPSIEPVADFEIWGINNETTYYEQMQEPYRLFEDQMYDYKVMGEGEQFVIWFGVAGDTAKKTPTGSEFVDRDINHLSKGTVTINGQSRYSYKDTGTYTLTFVASSYNYVLDDYKEDILQKEIVVIPADQ